MRRRTSELKNDDATNASESESAAATRGGDGSEGGGGGGGGYAGPRESAKDRSEKVAALNLRPLDLFSPSKPWILVEGGSILGYFDWVPESLRVGPWSSLAAPMLFLVASSCVCGTVIAFHPSSSSSSSRMLADDCDKDNESCLLSLLSEYPEFKSPLWYYNSIGFLWTGAISIGVLRGPAGPGAWATYTMWSWTILMVRHGLAALAPFWRNDQQRHDDNDNYTSSSSFIFFVQALELTRFPMLLMHSMTFFLWNFVLMPFVYFFCLKDPRERRNFLGYFTRFRLVQLHVFNIFFAYVNGVVASPPRRMGVQDFMVAVNITVLYVLWYLLVLDRIGVHLYPIFSPRTPHLVLTWCGLIAVCVLGFQVWKPIVAK